jgi:hypothetical protein
MGEIQIALAVVAINVLVLAIVGAAAYALNESTRTQFMNRTRGD